jgi:predicted Holliday junction resolvase-like endonuclease
MELGLAITLASLAIIVVVILAIIIYQQMLLLNEVNKRLLLMTKESIEKERYTMEELQNHLTTQMEATNSPKQEYTEEREELFDPHGYEERLP